MVIQRLQQFLGIFTYAANQQIPALEWIVDQMGRLGFDKLNGEPTEKDIQEFQVELRKVLR